MRKLVVFIILISIIICGCERKYGAFYDPPEGEEGVIYKQLASDARFSTFVSAIDKVPGLKDELSSSGLYTIMAPDNEAFNKFFASHPTYRLDVIPVDTLSLIVKYHIMKWMAFQVNFLYPGITKDNFSVFKYQSRANMAYSETTQLGRSRAIYYDSKMLQVYTPNFLSLYRMTEQDYAGIYGAGSTLAVETKMNVMGAKVTQIDISSGNGVIHVIDKVLVPPLNIIQKLTTDSEYSQFSQLMNNRFRSYTYNSAGTIAQGNYGDINGDGLIDSLFNRIYSFDDYLDIENPVSFTNAPITLTAFGPSKLAFTDYLNNTLGPGFKNNTDSIPNRTLNLLYQAHFSNTILWPSKVYAGEAINLLGDKIKVTQSDIIESSMLSNGAFYKVNKVIEPTAFKSITGPALLSLNNWYFAEMVVSTGLLSALSAEGTKYTLLCPSNEAFIKFGIFWYQYPPFGAKAGFYRTTAPGVYSSISATMLKSLVGNHIIINKELSAGQITDGFYPTFNNSFILVEGGKIHGALRDTVSVIVDPDHHQSNGYFHGISKPIMYPLNSIYTTINSASSWNYIPTPIAPVVTPEYTKFKELVIAAGINSKDFIAITAVDVDKRFTLFVPSNNAITAAQVAGILPKTGAVLPNEPNVSGVINDLVKRARLEAYLRYFFIQQKQILTDGTITGIFATSKKDPVLSTPTDPVYIKASITYTGGVVTFNEIGATSTGIVDMTQPTIYPQNKLAQDGIIQIINNAFTSKY